MRRLRSVEQIALCKVTSDSSKEIGLFLGFNTFRDDINIQAVSDLDDGLYKPCCSGTSGQASYE